MTKKSNIFITSAIWLFLAFSFLSIRVLSSAGLLSWMGKSADVVMSFVVQVGIMLLLSVALFSLLKRQNWKQTLSDFSFQKIGWKAVLISIAIGVIVYVLNIFVGSFFSLILDLLGYETMAQGTALQPIPVGSFLLMVVTGAILPGFCEEVSHRGMLLKGFEELGVKKAIFISALLFGFMHFDVNKMGYATVIGLFLGYITLLSRSVYPAMIVHFMNNFLISYVLFSRSNSLPFGKWVYSFFDSFGNGDLFSTFFGVILLVLGLGLMLSVLVMALFKQTSLKQLALATEELAKEQIRKEFLLETGVEVQRDIQTETTIAVDKEVVVGGKLKSVTIKIPIKLFGIKIHGHHKWTVEEKVLFGACMFLGAMVTVMTFLFGFI